MKKYIPRLAEGTDDQYTIHTDNFGTMLCGEQLDDEYVKLSAVLIALEKCEGDLDYFKSKLPESSYLEPYKPTTTVEEKGEKE